MHRQQGVFLSVHVDNIKMGEKDMRSKTHMGKMDDTNRSTRTNVRSGSSLLGMHAT